MSTSPHPPCPDDANSIDPLKKHNATVKPPSSSSPPSGSNALSEPLSQKSLTKNKATSKPRKRKMRNMCPKCKQSFPNVTLLEIHHCLDVESVSREKTLSERGLSGGAFQKIEKI